MKSDRDCCAECRLHDEVARNLEHDAAKSRDAVGREIRAALAAQAERAKETEAVAEERKVRERAVATKAGRVFRHG